MIEITDLPSNRTITSAGDRFRDSRETPNDHSVLQYFRIFRSYSLQQNMERIIGILQGRSVTIGCRVKRVESIIRKLKRFPGMDLVRMDDVIGVRIIIPSPVELEGCTELLSSQLPKSRIRDYIENPQNTGYRAIHITFKDDFQTKNAQNSRSFPVEIQLRTYYQHLWATTSESFGENVKAGGGTQEQQEYLNELSRRISDHESRHPNEIQIEGLSLGQDIIYVIINYDRNLGRIINENLFYGDLKSAVDYLIYLEETQRSKYNLEKVLILVSKTEEEQLTHIRYFSPYGVPDLPEMFTIDLDRP